jgi:hypothetical protein
MVVPCLRRLLPVTAGARVRSQVNPCEICGGESDTGTGLYTNTSVFPCQYNSTNVALLLFSTCCSYQKDKRAKTGNVPQKNALSEIGKRWIEESTVNLNGLTMQVSADTVTLT